MNVRFIRSFRRAAILNIFGAAVCCCGAQVITSGAPTTPVGAVDTAPPPIQREFRGVWIATVANMDWPSRPGLSTGDQQAEMVRLLDRAVAMHLNAIIFQVRPEADAFYKSESEPWSAFLTGHMGRAPDPYYDPLAFVVREAHARGLEVHAWFNPFRAIYPGSPGAVSPNHVSRTNPSMIRRYGPQTWMDPGDPKVVDRAIDAIVDVTKRYDIDAVHIDDYFYPYREENRRGRTIPFPDSREYRRYKKEGGTLELDDWRRNNLDGFVERADSAVHATKPWVRFGISPFGIWRPGYPASVRGLDSYVEIFADARKWLRNGWVDYLAPQLYWPIGRPQQDFSALLAWWVSQNTHGRNIWSGLNVALAKDTAPRGLGAAEMLDQIRLTRAQDGASGEIFFSMSTLVQDPDSVTERIAHDSYAQSALVPASPWLDSIVPPTPAVVTRVDSRSGELIADLTPPGDAPLPWLWVVQTRNDSAWTTQILPGAQVTPVLAGRGQTPPTDVRVYAVGRTGNLSLQARVVPAERPVSSMPASTRQATNAARL
jgi:uncharacterized lipoprotein YddW (UPF0748 family)